MYLNRTIVAAVAITIVAGFASADTIPPEEAVRHVGEHVTVEGRVSQVSVSGGGTTFINFGGRFPNHVFYAVIFRDNTNRFPGVHGIEGLAVAITGEVRMYKGKPEIILSSPAQLEKK